MVRTEQIILCRCVYRALFPEGLAQQVQERLGAAGIAFTPVDDLCELAAARAPLLSAMADHNRPLILACYPRAVRALLHAAGVPPSVSPRVLNLRALSADAILAEVGGSAEPPSAIPAAVSSDGSWVPWFPVIDYDRCVHCRQCVSFCPFGVYSVLEGKVVVTAPRNCKDNCPACARMCPRLAIIFPKAPDSPINGDDVTEQALRELRQRQNDQKQAPAGEDLHSVLAKRKLRARLR